MRIALLTDTWTPQVNGVVRTLERLVGHIRRRGGRVALVSPEGSVADPVAHLNIRVPGVPVPGYPELRLCRPLSREALGSLAALQPDAVHVATEATIGWSGVRWARFAGLPLITSYHTNFPDYLPGYGLGALQTPLWGWLRRFHEDADISLCPSEATRRDLLQRGFHDRFRVWPRGVDATRYTPNRRRQAVREELAPGAEIVVLYVGRLAAEKRVPLLLDAFREVRVRASRPAKLVVVGDGPAADSLRAEGQEDVVFTGYLAGDALADAYAAADIFAFPSDTETFGNVVVEAMASGVPVVAPDRGGVVDSVHPGVTGELFTAGDPRAMARAILSVVEDDQRRARLAAGARAHAERLNWTRILDGVLAAYRQARHLPSQVAA